MRNSEFEIRISEIRFWGSEVGIWNSECRLIAQEVSGLIEGLEANPKLKIQNSKLAINPVDHSQ
jgi:hypothetical protein